jgi:hypothetical protein
MSVPADTVRRVNLKGGETMRDVTTDAWAQILTLGDARFGILAGGPFDGRCYPLPDGGIPQELLVPGPRGPGQPGVVRYTLRDGLYRYAGAARPVVPAA